jgi:putative FmdB family regulatory protein
MPIFSYSCKQCGNKFELLEGMTARKAARKCPSCGSGKIEKIFSSFSVGAASGGSDFSAGASCPTCSTGTCGL